MNIPSGSSKLSPIELAKSIAALRGLTDSAKEFDAIKAALVEESSIPRVNQILDGIAQEDEFAMFCKIMGTCESISRIDQSPIVSSEEKAADFLVSFRPGISTKGLSKEDVNVRYNCFVEVKSCSKRKFSISAKDLQARRKYASRFGLPLVLAVRFLEFGRHTLWVLMDADFLEKRGRKINCTDLTESLTQVLFDDYAFYTDPSLCLIHNYDRTEGLNGLKSPQWGTMTSTVIYLDHHEPIEIPANMAIGINVFFQSFEQKVIQTETDGEKSVVVSHVGHQMRVLSDLAYSSNYLATDADGESSFNARHSIARMDSSSKPVLITRDTIENIAAYINSHKTMLFKIGIGDSQHQERTLRKIAR